MEERENKIRELLADGWLTMKQWRAEEAKRQGVCDIAIAMRITRGAYKNLQRYEFNKRVVYVKADET
jgi:hypothetical protein